jgi:hypothetical protein
MAPARVARDRNVSDPPMLADDGSRGIGTLPTMYGGNYGRPGWVESSKLSWLCDATLTLAW